MSLELKYKVVCDECDRLSAHFVAAKIRAGKVIRPTKQKYEWMKKHGIDLAQVLKDSSLVKNRDRYKKELESIHHELKMVSAKRRMLKQKIEKKTKEIRNNIRNAKYESLCIGAE